MRYGNQALRWPVVPRSGTRIAFHHELLLRRGATSGQSAKMNEVVIEALLHTRAGRESL
jgi:hypothetical protein